MKAESVKDNGLPEQHDDAVPAVIIEQPKAEDAAAAKQKRHRRRVRAFRSFILRLLALVLVVYILMFHIVGLTLMPNGDMSPRLDAGDLLLFYRVDRKAKAQDIVVIDKVTGGQQAGGNGTAENGEGAGSTEPNFFRKALNWLGFKDPNAPPTRRHVCRVVACAGDIVDVTEERGLVVNGNAVIESNIFHPTRPYEGKVEYPVKLEEGQYFVMADLRNGGMDSRYFGPVSQDEIEGIVITLLRRNNL